MTALDPASLAARHDLVLFDLDGVVYLVDEPIGKAVETIGTLRRHDRALAYVTNNASRRSAQVAALLSGMGVPAQPAEVVTSAAAAAQVLADLLPPESAVLVVGAPALSAEVRDAGLMPVTTAQPAPAAVVQGYGPAVSWAELAEAAVAVRGGATWVVTNLDRTLPSPRGPLPGNGSLVAVLRTALGREPDIVVGKPEPTLFRRAAQQAAAAAPLVVGDRLDTDIAGANRAGMDSLLVLTGVSDAGDLLAAAPPERPTHVALDLAGLVDPAAVARLAGPHGRSTLSGASGWRLTGEEAAPTLAGDGPILEALRLLCAAAWAASAAGSAATARSGFFEHVRADGSAAAQALRVLGLAG